PWRPQFHATPPDTWMNDPNGMVVFEGEYHLFYQNNPYGNRWGHMSWAHAVSRDLVHWEHLPLALAEENGVMIFSGSAVVDWKNTTGFGRDGRPPMVAIYTGHHTGRPLQNQHIAYSTDRGRTWTKFAGNPVLDIGEADFRDPKVFWHEGTGRWVMAVAWPPKRMVRFYGSPDLKVWTHLSDFGPAGSTEGIWECPDLVPVTVEGRRSAAPWVLVVNVGSGAPAGGSGTQYFVGDFDGTRFTTRTPATGTQPGALWADFGRDFYAAVTWSDVPPRDGRRLWIGWMSNWTYANEVPTQPWRSAMTVPRSLTLRETPAGLRLVQQPVRELQTLRGRREHLGRSPGTRAARWLQARQIPNGLAELDITWDRVPGSGKLVLRAVHGFTGTTEISADLDAGELRLDRTRSGRSEFSPHFAGVHRAPIRLTDGRLRLQILADVSSLEVFAQDGETVLTDLVLPESPGLRWELEAHGDANKASVASISLWPLAAAMPRIGLDTP
ncbi:MAG: glycoside hydrolase family 32 protein, partial [Verrucomicrobia bacterium]|nr:glycoside hydrolase family 32 protein [Verrucomicrobiota bacterium]